MNYQKAFLPLVILGFIMIILVGVGGYYLGINHSKLSIEPTVVPSIMPTTFLSPLPLQPEETGCSYDAKICSDGTVVLRTGPNCEYTLCPEDNLGPPIELTPVPNTKGCSTGGCSGELCTEATDDPLMSTCQYKEEYICLKRSRCERQSNGKCGWTQTPEYTQCLSGTKSNSLNGIQ